MEKKNKKELLLIIEEQDKNLQKYKSRLHDIIGAYKNLLAEKETLENSIKSLTEVSDVTNVSTVETSGLEENAVNVNLESRNDQCIQNLKNNLGALTVEKSRIENELKADRKKILLQKEELEKKLTDTENKLLLQKENYDNQVLELRKKINNQQKEREKEQQDHVLMLKELQNILASERGAKEKLEQQISELQQKFSGKVSERKVADYEKCLNDIRSEVKTYQDALNASKKEARKKDVLLLKMQEEIENMKLQYKSKLQEEKCRADNAEEKLGMLVFVKEKRIGTLESRISELSALVGDHDKIKQQDQINIQKLKARISQLQVECSAFSHISTDDSKLWKYQESSNTQDNVSASWNNPEPTNISSTESQPNENLHLTCQAEILQLKNEIEQYKTKCETALKETCNKTSTALMSNNVEKEIKELKSKVAHLQNQLRSCKSQLKLNEEYHSKITFNLEKACEDLKLTHKQEIAQIEASNKANLLNFERQIQKQRERTLLLLEEKDKEISILKSSFLSSFIKKENHSENNETEDEVFLTENQDITANVLPNSLISSKKDGHILHYVQELARKDVELSNLRQSRIQSETSLRRLQQTLSAVKEKYFDEIDALKSRIKLLESTQDKEGTNVEYLKNVVLRFLRCDDPNSRKHMINAIATILHFTNNEIQDLKGFV